MCLSTKAVHLELISFLSIDAFLSVLSRFITHFELLILSCYYFVLSVQQFCSISIETSTTKPNSCLSEIRSLLGIVISYGVSDVFSFVCLSLEPLFSDANLQPWELLNEQCFKCQFNLKSIKHVQVKTAVSRWPECWVLD